MASIRARTNPSGEVVYHAQIRIKGMPPQTATFERKTDAKHWAAETESAIRNRRYFSPNNANKHTVKDLIDRYIKEVVPTKPKAARDLKSQLGWWSENYGKYSLNELTPSLISSARDRLLGEITVRGKLRSSGTVLRYMASLSTALSTAVRDWNWLEQSPIERVTKPKPARGRVRYLDDDERTSLLEACKTSKNPFLYPVVVLALSTGMRLGEIRGLRWENLDLDGEAKTGRAYLLETKNGERRTVPLAERALKELRELKALVMLAEDAKPGKLKGLVFPSLRLARDESMDLRAPWELALQQSGVQDFRFHDLRHSAASYLAMNGATLVEIAEILGHRTLQMVKRYTHLSELHTTRVVEKMNKSIF